MNDEKKVRYIQYHALDFTGFTVVGPRLSLSDASRLEQEVSEESPWHHVWVDADPLEGFRVNLAPEPTFQRYKSELKKELFRNTIDKTLQHFGTRLGEVAEDYTLKPSSGNLYL